MSVKTYNLIVSLVGFLTSIAIVVLKILGIISFSWWVVLIPVLLVLMFQEDEDD